MKNAFEYEAELAALREELAILRPERDLYKASSEALEDQWHAAEQRNADLEKLLIRCHNSDNLSQNCGLWKALDAALKPTESGASE